MQAVRPSTGSIVTDFILFYYFISRRLYLKKESVAMLWTYS